MAIIFTYPTKATPALADAVIITDSESQDPEDRTKQASIASIKTTMGVVDGNGTAYKIPMWSDSDTLTDSTAASGLTTTVAGAVELYYAGVKKFETTASGSTLTGGLSLSDGTNNVTISAPTITTSYDLKMPASIGTASQVLKLPSTIGASPYQLAWGDAGSGSGTGGFETLPFSTANGYITTTGTYVFQMIAPSNCAPTNFKFYHLLAQTTGPTAVAIYKGDINDGGSLQSTGEITSALDSNQISGSTLTVQDGATAISAGDDILVCLSFTENISPLGVIPITATGDAGGVTLANASPVSNEKLALFGSEKLEAAEFPSTISGLISALTSAAATTTRPFLLIYDS